MCNNGLSSGTVLFPVEVFMDYAAHSHLLVLNLPQLTAYFHALATPDTGKVVQVVEDAGVERAIKQSELDGGVALKLDIVADAPVIKMPKTSDSNE